MRSIMRGCCLFNQDHLIVSVLLLACIGNNAHGYKGDRGCRTIKLLPLQASQYLEGHVFRNLTTGYTECEHWCLREDRCVSVNIGRTIEGGIICELCDSDHCQHPEDLKPRRGWTYRGTENPCCINPCVNNGKCFMGYTDKKYVCKCSSGYTGENCEKDIDECSNNIHDCNENAACVNIAGHFHCICKPGFTGDGQSCSDCTRSSHRFEKCQDLPTKGAVDVEHFTIGGSVFLAFANHIGNTEGYKVDSYIYKLNESAGNFILYQTIDTTGARRIEHHVIADNHYLAVANFRDAFNDHLNSTIYQWNGHEFVTFQNIETFKATSLTFFKISTDLFLAVTQNKGGFSYIYKWKDNLFQEFQRVETKRAWATTVLTINNETFIVVANRGTPEQGYSANSSLMKWTGKEFTKMQSLQTYGATDVKSFYIKNEAFLVFANRENGTSGNIDSFIYKWNGSEFVLFQSIPTKEAAAWQPFVMCGQMFLCVANLNGKSIVYRYSESGFVRYRELPTSKAHGLTSYEYKGNKYLAVTKWDLNTNSTLYKWA